MGSVYAFLTHIYSSLTEKKDRRTTTLFFIGIIGLTLYRILVLFQPHLSLFYDEAYYYHWSLTPDLGYYSKPPFIAWLIATTTYLVGHSVVGVKLAAPILYSASGYVIYLSGQRIASRSVGIISAVVFLSATVIGFNSVFITTDAPLIFFWSLSIYLFITSIQSNRTVHWIALGLSVGGGMLSKYTMAALPLSLFLFLLINPNQRTKLKSYKPWLAALIAAALFSLNLWWNSENHWVTFAHTSEISQQDKSDFNLAGFFEFLAGQIFVIGPVWFFLALRLLKTRKDNLSSCKTEFDWVTQMLLFSTLVILVIIALQAVTSRAYINWAAPWVVGCSLLIGIYAWNVNITKYLRIGLTAHLLLLSAFYHWPVLLDTLQVEPSRKNNPYQRLAGWDGVGMQLAPTLDQHPDHILASDSRHLLAYVGFHAKPGEGEFARWNPDGGDIRDHYDLKYNFRRHRDTNQGFIFISKHPIEPEQRSKFDIVHALEPITENVFKDKQHRVYTYRLQGFNGYE